MSAVNSDKSSIRILKVSETVISRGEVTPGDLQKCYELGQLIAAGCEMKIF